MIDDSARPFTLVMEDHFYCSDAVLRTPYRSRAAASPASSRTFLLDLGRTSPMPPPRPG